MLKTPITYLQSANLPNPEFIYHYTSPFGLKGILESKTVWFSDYIFLNDSSEYSHIYTLFHDQLHIMPSITSDFIKLIDDNFAAEFGKTNDFPPIGSSYVASFSMNPDTSSMWNYYTKTADHVGYNLKFSCNLLTTSIKNYCSTFKQHSNYMCSFGSVIYDNDSKRAILNTILNDSYEYYKNHTSDSDVANLIKKLKDILFHLSIFFKHDGFKYEEEYRIAVHLIDTTCTPSIMPEYKISSGIFVPYTAIPFDGFALQKINVSPMANKDIAALSTSIIHFN